MAYDGNYEAAKIHAEHKPEEEFEQAHKEQDRLDKIAQRDAWEKDMTEMGEAWEKDMSKLDESGSQSPKIE